MAKYVDGFVLVIPKNKISDYKKMASDGAKTWKKYGALEYYECIGDDLNPKGIDGIKPLGFTKMIKAKSDESVWFSFIVYKSKKHRDEVNAKVMAEYSKNKKKFKEPMPFDMKRLAHGGFDVVIEG